NGAQDMRILRPVFAGQIGGGRHDLRPPVLLADLERHEDLEGLVGFHHSAATFFRGAIMSRMTPETPSVRTSITSPSDVTVTRRTSNCAIRVCSAGNSWPQTSSNVCSAEMTS